MPEFQKLFNGKWCRLTRGTGGCSFLGNYDVFEYPNQAMRDAFNAQEVIPYIVGFENDEVDGTGSKFKIIMSNGDRSTQREEWPTNSTQMFPPGSHKMIRAVKIHFRKAIIGGFSFFDKEGALIMKIGLTTGPLIIDYHYVRLDENEVIVGVVAKLN